MFHRFVELFTSVEGPRTEADGSCSARSNFLSFVLFLLYSIFKGSGISYGWEAITAFRRDFSSFKGTRGAVGDLGFIGEVCASIKWFFSSCYIAGRDGSFAVFTPTSYNDWYQKSSEVLDRHHFVGITDSLTLTAYILSVEKTIDEGLVLVVDEQGPVLKIILDRIEALRSVLRGEELLKLVKSLHHTPIFFGISGKPRAGKTHLLHRLAVLDAHARGVEYDPSTLFVMNPGDQYCSGLRSSCRVFVVDDVASVSEKVSPELALAPLKLVMELANDQLSATVQADIADKGKIYARPTTVLVTSNDPMFGASALNYKAAFLRRIRYRILLEVLPEYRQGLTKSVNGYDYAVDPSKVAGLPPWTPIHTFRVVEFTLRSNSDPDLIHPFNSQITPGDDIANVEEVLVLGTRDAGVTEDVFRKWFVDKCRSHHEQSKLVAKTSSAEDKMTLCTICYGIDCNCLHSPVTEGGALTLPARFSDYVTRTTVNAFTTVSDPISVLRAAGWRKVLSSVKFLGDFIKNSVFDIFEDPAFIGDLTDLLGLVAVTGVAFSSMSNSYTSRLAQGYLPPVDSGPAKATELTSAQLESDLCDAHWTRSAIDADSGADADVWVGGVGRPSGALSPDCASISPEALADLVRRHFVRVSFIAPDGGKKTVGGILMSTGCVVTVGHILTPGSILQIASKDESTVFDFPHDVVSHYVRKVSDDVLVIDVPPTFSTRYNLWKYTGDDMVPPGSTWKGLYVSQSTTVSRHTSVCGYLPNRPLLAHDKYGRPMTYSHGLLAAVDIGDTKFGDCGSALICATAQGAFLAGFHAVSAAHVDRITGKSTRWALSVPLDARSRYGSVMDSYRNFERFPHIVPTSNGLALAPDLPISTSFHHKSYAVHRPLHHGPLPEFCKVLGQLNTPIAVSKTKYVPAPLRGYVDTSTKVPIDFRVGVVNGMYQNPTHAAFEKMIAGRSTSCPPYAEMLESCEALSAHYNDILELSNQGALPLSERESLNGIDGVLYIDAVKHGKAAGHPAKGSKRQFVQGPIGDLSYTKAARRHFDYVAASVARGTNPGLFGRVTLKDELLKPGKGARGFVVQNFAFNDLMRRITLPLVRIMQLNPLLSGIAIGMNAQGYMWGELAEKHAGFKNHFDWDFRSYDHSHVRMMIVLAGRFFYNLLNTLYPEGATVAGYPWHLVLSHGFSILASPLYVFENVLYQLDGTLGSGAWITAMINSVIQHIYHGAIWKKYATIENLSPSIRNFRRHVAIDVYGDDGIGSTSLPNYGFNFMREVFASWGIVITPANKIEGATQDFIPVEDVEFLKRGFSRVLVDDVPVILGPLLVDSILKPLNYWAPPKEVSPGDQILQNVECAQRELSHHPEAVWRPIWDKIKIGVRATFPAHEGLQEVLETTPRQVLEMRVSDLMVSESSPSGDALWSKHNSKTPHDYYAIQYGLI